MVNRHLDLIANRTRTDAASHELVELHRSASPSKADSASRPLDDNLSHQDAIAQLWLPNSLKIHSHTVFLAAFLALAVALPALYATSERRHGLSTTDVKYHYLWTYGPTALFTLIAVFWSRLEYRSKELMPWVVMYDGIAPASQTVLLDYVSIWSIKALFRSVKNGHYIVALSVTGSLLLSLMIVFSTGLFAIQDVGMDAHVPITILEVFNSSDFTVNNTNMSPWATSYGIRYNNLSYPYGTTEHHVFPRFNVSTTAEVSYNRSDAIKTDVDTLTFDLPCEKADMKFNEWYGSGYGWHTNITLSTPTCNSTSEISDLAGPLFGNLGYWSGFRIDTSACDVGDPNTLHVNAIVRSANGTVGQPVHTWSNETWHYQFVALICTPIYNMSRASVSYRADIGSGKPETVVTLSSTTQVLTLTGVTSSDLLEAIWDIYKPTFVSSLLNDFGDDADWLNDTTVLEQVVRTSHNIIGTQIAKEKLLQPATTPAKGTISRTEHRLFVRHLSFGLLEAISIVLAAIIVSMLLLKPPRVCSRDPSSIGGLANILAQSPELIQSLRNLGAASNMELSQHLHGLSYRTVLHSTYSGRPSFRICPLGPSLQSTSTGNIGGQNAGFNSSSMSTSKATSINWWRPLSISIIARGLVICSPIAIIIALEILYRKSISSNGVVAALTTDTYV